VPAKRGRPKNRIATQQVSTYLAVDLEQEIRRLAALEGITIADWLRRLVLRELRPEG
jgi:hypothetical protein